MEQAELEFVYFMKGISGSFRTNLFTTIMSADIENQIKLSLGFPNEVEVVRKYRNEEGYWQKILEKNG
jgi:ribulose bisphosphate carboxylase small subunit